MLFLFSKVGEEDAPTRIRVGSHLDVPKVLEKYGEDGPSGLALAPDLVAASDHRPLALAIGSPGDVFLCHPFLVHAAQPHRGVRPRFMAQPPLVPAAPYELERADGAYSPVEMANRASAGPGFRRSRAGTYRGHFGAPPAPDVLRTLWHAAAGVHPKPSAHPLERRSACGARHAAGYRGALRLQLRRGVRTGVPCHARHRAGRGPTYRRRIGIRVASGMVDHGEAR